MLYIRRWPVLWREAKWRRGWDLRIVARKGSTRKECLVGMREEAHGHLEKEDCRQREQHVQRSQGRIMAHVNHMWASDHSMLVTARGEKVSVEGNQRAGLCTAICAWWRFQFHWGGQDRWQALVKGLTGPLWLPCWEWMVGGDGRGRCHGNNQVGDLWWEFGEKSNEGEKCQVLEECRRMIRFADGPGIGTEESKGTAGCLSWTSARTNWRLLLGMTEEGPWLGGKARNSGLEMYLGCLLDSQWRWGTDS